MCILCALCSGGKNVLNGGATANIRKDSEGMELGGREKTEISYQNVGGSPVDDEKDRKKTCDEILEDPNSTMDNSFGNKRSSDGEEGLPDEDF